MATHKLDLAEIPPAVRKQIRGPAGGPKRQFLLATGLEPAVVGYILPVVRALYMNGFNVDVLACEDSARWLWAARELFSDFRYRVRSDFKGPRDHLFLYEETNLIYRPRLKQFSRQVSWVARWWGGYDYYSEPYVGRNEPHVFMAIIRQCGLETVPESIDEPLETTVPVQDRDITTNLYDTRAFQPPGPCNLYDTGQITRQTVEAGLAAKTMLAPQSFITTLRVLVDRTTEVIEPRKRINRPLYFCPVKFTELDLSSIKSIAQTT